jgi:non-heme chloroperoxidase
MCVMELSVSVSVDDLKKLKLPALIVHGKDDQSVPVGDSTHISTQPIWNTTLKVCPGLSRTLRDIFNGDPLRLPEDLTSFGAAPYPPPLGAAP